MKFSGMARTRRILAALVLLAFCIVFAWAGLLPGVARIASFQAGPALLAGSFLFLAILAAATFLFGRLYCSLLCPLGLTQDLLSRLRKKRNYRPMPARNWLRLGILALFAASLASGYLFVFELIDPYSAFGRMASAILGPLAAGLENALAWCLRLFGADAPFGREMIFHGWPALFAAILTLGILLPLVLKKGRVWCNYCPIGTGLGLVAGKALFRPRILADKCVSCGICQKKCKTGCIDIARGEIDASRCVSCLDCAEACPKEAISFVGSKKGEDSPKLANASRRALLKGVAPALGLAAALPNLAEAAVEKINRPDIVPEGRSRRERPLPLVPPGAKSLAHFREKCIGCQLCVESCPNNVLGTSASGPGILQPGMSFEAGYCRPNCVKCGEVCPAGAIERIDLAQKKNIRIGLAAIDRQRCIINKDKTQCVACYKICPQKAISLQEDPSLPDNLRIPQVDAELCVGCGACEYVCPAMPLAAIAVDALPAHETPGSSAS